MDFASETFMSQLLEPPNPRNIPNRLVRIVPNFPLLIKDISYYSFEDFKIDLVTSL